MTIQVAVEPVSRNEAGLAAVVPILAERFGSRFVRSEAVRRQLAGMPPVEAAKYQVFVLFLLAGAAALVVAATTYAAAWRATDARHRLRLDRLRGG